ncbi:MAG: hypothetical protein M1827_000409 [Pycnora praestabilis]|nr:MAG: hypothetical protein M1827_000409 [Pycnora praestabilis]
MTTNYQPWPILADITNDAEEDVYKGDVATWYDVQIMTHDIVWGCTARYGGGGSAIFGESSKTVCHRRYQSARDNALNLAVAPLMHLANVVQPDRAASLANAWAAVDMDSSEESEGEDEGGNKENQGDLSEEDDAEAISHCMTGYAFTIHDCCEGYQWKALGLPSNKGAATVGTLLGIGTAKLLSGIGWCSSQ